MLEIERFNSQKFADIFDLVIKIKCVASSVVCLYLCSLQAKKVLSNLTNLNF